MVLMKIIIIISVKLIKNGSTNNDTHLKLNLVLECFGVSKVTQSKNFELRFS